MLFNEMTFIGIDPTAGKIPFQFAAFDHQLSLLALSRGDFEDVLAFVGGQEAAFVAVNAPRQPNLGIMADEARRAALQPPPRTGRFLDYRLAEYILCQHNIRTTRTPAMESECQKWVQMGFLLYRRLNDMGYAVYPAGDAARQVLEVYPHASFCLWLKRAPFAKRALEGRLQRQLVLFELGVGVPDPMAYFKEITRYRLLQGLLPEELLYEPTELDALAAAYSAWLAAMYPDQVSLIGDSQEGQILLPGTGLMKMK